MFCKLKTVVSLLRVIVTLLSLRPFEHNSKIFIVLMNVFEKSLFESVELELLLSSAFTLLLLPLNKNCLSNILGFCVYVINTIIHGCLEI